MARVLGFGGMAALSVVIGAAAPAQEVAAIDFTALLDSCNAAPVECQAVLTAQITRIEALPVPKEVRTQYLQTLATVAAIAAQDNAGLAADMAAVVADVAETVAEGEPEVAEALADVSGQLQRSEGVDLSEIAGSPS